MPNQDAPQGLPAGIVICEDCGTVRGEGVWTDRWGSRVTKSTCLCEGVVCKVCRERNIRRPVASYYDPERGWRHVYYAACFDRRCWLCRWREGAVTLERLYEAWPNGRPWAKRSGECLVTFQRKRIPIRSTTRLGCRAAPCSPSPVWRGAVHRRVELVAVRGLLAAVVAGIALTATPAVADAYIKPLGNGLFCHTSMNQFTCAGVFHRKSKAAVTVIRQKEAQGTSRPPRHVRNFNYKACSTAPSGKTRCVPRRTHRRTPPQAPELRFAYDTFSFTSAFPHRENGIYKLTFRRHGKQWGQTIRLKKIV